MQYVQIVVEDTLEQRFICSREQVTDISKVLDDFNKITTISNDFVYAMGQVAWTS